MVLVGGYSQGGFLATVHHFTPPSSGTAAAWHSLPSLDGPRAFAGAAAVGDQLFVVGGGVSDQSFDSVVRCGRQDATRPNPKLEAR